MAVIQDTDSTTFENLLFFEREVAQPQIVKWEIDVLMPKLRKIGINHKNIVISKVVQTNPVKKTMLMQIRMPIDVNEQLDQFLADNPQYSLEPSFAIKKGLKLVITNNEQDFRNGIQRLMSQRPGFDMSQNPIIEMSRISYDGKVMGFELFLEN